MFGQAATSRRSQIWGPPDERAKGWSVGLSRATSPLEPSPEFMFTLANTSRASHDGRHPSRASLRRFQASPRRHSTCCERNPVRRTRPPGRRRLQGARPGCALVGDSLAAPASFSASNSCYHSGVPRQEGRVGKPLTLAMHAIRLARRKHRSPPRRRKTVPPSPTGAHAHHEGSSGRATRDADCFANRPSVQSSAHDRRLRTRRGRSGAPPRAARGEARRRSVDERSTDSASGLLYGTRRPRWGGSGLVAPPAPPAARAPVQATRVASAGGGRRRCMLRGKWSG
jgi:hypothetical protein